MKRMDGSRLCRCAGPYCTLYPSISSREHRFRISIPLMANPPSPDRPRHDPHHPPSCLFNPHPPHSNLHHLRPRPFPPRIKIQRRHRPRRIRAGVCGRDGGRVGGWRRVDGVDEARGDGDGGAEYVFALGFDGFRWDVDLES